MAQRGIGRSALAVGLLVLAVLIAGRMVGSWYHQDQIPLADRPGHPATSHSSDRSAGSTAGQASPSPTGTTGRAGTAANAGPNPPAGAPQPGQPEAAGDRIAGNQAALRPSGPHLRREAFHRLVRGGAHLRRRPGPDLDAAGAGPAEAATA